jgi:hypothetical protein
MNNNTLERTFQSKNESIKESMQNAQIMNPRTWTFTQAQKNLKAMRATRKANYTRYGYITTSMGPYSKAFVLVKNALSDVDRETARRYHNKLVTLINALWRIARTLNYRYMPYLYLENNSKNHCVRKWLVDSIQQLENTRSRHEEAVGTDYRAHEPKIEKTFYAHINNNTNVKSESNIRELIDATMNANPESFAMTEYNVLYNMAKVLAFGYVESNPEHFVLDSKGIPLKFSSNTHYNRTRYACKFDEDMPPEAIIKMFQHNYIDPTVEGLSVGEHLAGPTSPNAHGGKRRKTRKSRK